VQVCVLSVARKAGRSLPRDGWHRCDTSLRLRLDNGFCIIYNTASVAISTTRPGLRSRRPHAYAVFYDCTAARYRAILCAVGRPSVSDWPSLSAGLNAARLVARPTHHTPFRRRRSNMAAQHSTGFEDRGRPSAQQNTIRCAISSAKQQLNPTHRCKWRLYDQEL